MNSVRLAAGVAAMLVLVSCDGDGSGDGPVDGVDGQESADSEAADDGAETSDDAEANGGDTEGPPELESTVTVEPLDVPLTSAEVRVGEVIVEFDGEVTDEGTVLTLEEPILFDFDSSVLRSSAAEPLDDIAEVLAFYETAPVEVIGHTDSQGTREYNVGLSQDRADAVMGALRERGIPSDRMSAQGRAFDEPVASNDTEEGRARNRRVEVLIIGVVPPGHEDT